jgi:uncharacterized RDD family membrane protein YckC
VGSRAAAYIIDLLLLLLLWLMFVMVLVLRFPGQLPTLKVLGMLVGGWMVTEVLMFTVQERVLQGQTIGKRYMGIRVTDATGKPPTMGQILIRNLLRPIDNLPHGFTLGTILVGLSERGCRLGDRAAGTRVVHDPFAAPQSPPLQIPADASAGERAVLEQWFRSEPNLAPDARVHLAKRMVTWVDRRWPDHMGTDGDAVQRMAGAFGLPGVP